MTGPKLRLLVVMSLMNGALIGAAPAVSAQAVDGYLSGTITDALSGNHVEEGCAVAHDTATTDLRAAPFVGIAGSDRTGAYSLALAPGDYYISFADCLNWDYKWRWYGGDTPVKVTIAAGLTTNVDFALQPAELTGMVNPTQGEWHITRPRSNIVVSFFYGNPGDYPIIGDWDCNGTDTPGLYRQSDGYVYLRNSNTQGNADIRFFFGNPGDVPLAGDFNGNGCDTISIYRPAEGRFFIINELGANDGGLGAADSDFLFGDPGDKPFVGDFDYDGTDTVALHRESTGLVYYRNTNTQGNADNQFVFGDPGDAVVSGQFGNELFDTPGLYRPSDQVWYIKHTNATGNADRELSWGGFAQTNWIPIPGEYGIGALPPGVLFSGSGNFVAKSNSASVELP